MVLLDHLPIENERIELTVVEEQIEGARRQLLRQLTRRAFDEGDMNRRIARRKATEDRRQYIRYEEIRPADTERAMPELREVTHIALEAVLRIHDTLHRTDVLLPNLSEMNRVRAPVENRRIDPLLLLFHRRTERRLTDKELLRRTGKAHLLINLIDIAHRLEHISSTSCLAPPFGDTSIITGGTILHYLPGTTASRTDDELSGRRHWPAQDDGRSGLQTPCKARHIIVCRL